MSNPLCYGNVFASSDQSAATRRLFAAIRRKDVEGVAEVLRRHSAGGADDVLDLDSRDEEGHTCCGLASGDGNRAIVKLLLQAGFFIIVNFKVSETDCLS